MASDPIVVRTPRARHRTLLTAAVLLMAASLASAAAGQGSFQHRYLMRGQVLETQAGKVVICVGKDDGAEVGQVLDVVRHVRTPPRGKTVGPRYRRDEIGTVKITSLFDGHYAMAEVVKGTPKVNDTVELEKSP